MQTLENAPSGFLAQHVLNCVGSQGRGFSRGSMRSETTIRIAAIVAFAALTSLQGCDCGGGTTPDGGSGPDASSGGEPLGELLTQVGQILCNEETQCLGLAAYLASSCSTEFSADFGVIEADVDAGLIIYHPGQAPACVAELNQEFSTCGLFNGTSSTACTAVFTGTVAAGGSCNTAEECAAGACVQGDGGCQGTCVGYAELGQNCSTADCDPNQNIVCVSSFTDAGTEVSTCIAPPGQGQPCPAFTCQANLTCLMGTCQTPGGQGAACDGICESGFYCSSPANTCVPSVADGGSCNATDQCSGTLSCVGLVTTGGTVTPGQCLPLVDVNGPCTPPSSTTSFTITGCKLGLACVSGTCQIPPTSGPCTADPSALCDSRTAYCDSSSMCVAKQPNGSNCQTTLGGVDCVSGVCNSMGQCAPRCTL
jgi:hypothetical protein